MGIAAALTVFTAMSSFAQEAGETKDAKMESNTDHPRKNRLADATSPYLLQHADNPVDWYPWGDAALEKARRENKPIFLSIGYAACHWCHVMERESFEDIEIAKILNEHFVAIKVDREERPDIDAVYMEATVAMTGSGGWPMSVFLTPEDLAPFLAGTYFPPREMHGLPSFRSILLQVVQAWDEDSEHIKERGAEIVKILRKTRENALLSDTPLGEAFKPSFFEQATDAMELNFDSQYGGFGSSTKFPSPHILKFLLRRHYRTGNADILRMVQLTLERMADSGMYDQAGGGFHRYATDRQWNVPHFEKMLYDQSQLATVYLEALQVTGNPTYARIARETLDYVLRDLTDPAGGFHSSEDADSQGEEGLFYTWKSDEFAKALTKEDAELAIQFYRVSSGGNFEGRNILIPTEPREAYSLSLGMEPDAFSEKLDALNENLRRYRDEHHPRPRRDDKVLAAWNANMISALCKGAQVLGDKRYSDAAERAADFILKEMLEDGLLARSWRRGEDGQGRTSGPGYLDDYAEMIIALLDIYQTTFDLKRIDQAEELAKAMIAQFGRENTGFRYAARADGPLLADQTPVADNATPSPNASAALALLRLGSLLDNEDYGKKGRSVLLAFAAGMQEAPPRHLDLLSAADFALAEKSIIALVAKGGPDEARPMLKAVHARFLPNTLLAASDGSASAAARLPVLEYRSPINGQPTAYICEGFTCKRPATTLDELQKLLDATR